MNEITLTDEQANEHIKARCLSYLDTLGYAKNLTAEQKKSFIEIAQAFRLNPFIREIYAIGYSDRQTGRVNLSIITGYETYLKRAERTGKLDGWKCVTLENGDSECTIWRKDWREPFIYLLKANEFVGTSPIWKNRAFMHRKVCISQAFRQAFPDELGGMPYTPEEQSTYKPDKAVYQEQLPLEPPHDDIKEYRDKAFANIKAYTPTDAEISIIDNAKNPAEIDNALLSAKCRFERLRADAANPRAGWSDGDYRYHIREGWDRLKYTEKHKGNSLKKAEINSLEVATIEQMEAYYCHLVDEFNKSKTSGGAVNAD